MTHDLTALADELHRYTRLTGGDLDKLLDRAASALRAAAVQGEPVAWKYEAETLVGTWEWHVSFDEPQGEPWRRNVEPLFTAPPPAAGWDEAIEAAMFAIETLRINVAADLKDPRHQGQRGMDRTDALYDAYQVLEALRTTPAATKSADAGGERQLTDDEQGRIVNAVMASGTVVGSLPDHGGADAGGGPIPRKEDDCLGLCKDKGCQLPDRCISSTDDEYIRGYKDGLVAALSHQPAPVAANASAEAKNALYWAVGRWNDEVLNRPLQNIHRRSLDTTWRQVIRHFGGDDRELCGPTHDELLDGGAHPHDSDCDKQKECCDLAAKEPCSDCPFPNPDAAMRGLTDLERTLLIASKAAQNYIANTESELGMTLKSGELLRAAIAKAEACEISTHPHASDCDKQGPIPSGYGEYTPITVGGSTTKSEASSHEKRRLDASDEQTSTGPETSISPVRIIAQRHVSTPSANHDVTAGRGRQPHASAEQVTDNQIAYAHELAEDRRRAWNASAEARIKYLEDEREVIRAEAAVNSRLIDDIASYVGCPHGEELTLDHIKQPISTLREKLSAALAGDLQHKSDCAVYLAPAYEPRECDCGAKDASTEARLREALEKTSRALEEIKAIVWGECPSLLNEDSGGNARLDMDIDDALEAAQRALFTHPHKQGELYLSRPVCRCFDDRSRELCLQKDKCRPVAKAFAVDVSDRTADVTAIEVIRLLRQHVFVNLEGAEAFTRDLFRSFTIGRR